jgi:hypothetical protein
MTTDGAKNERLGASQLVKEGNDIHCKAHNIQLAINDVFSSTQAHPPPECAIHRRVVRKCHDLVVLINGHKGVYASFSVLAALKRSQDAGARKFDALVMDCETRWDSELALIERVVYFDAEILQLYAIPQLGIDASCILSRYEFDLVFAITLVLEPFREFTKFSQNREKVTLAYVPHMIDQLVTRLQPGSFENALRGRSDGVLADMELFQARLVTSIKTRFASDFHEHSLALAALLFTPGPNRFVFEHFEVPENIVELVIAKVVDDVLELLPVNTPAYLRARTRERAGTALRDIREDLDLLAEDMDPLVWIPSQQQFSLIFPVAMMLLAIPDSTGEDERCFSSAGEVLSKCRTRLDIDNFRNEHLVRRFITGGSNRHSQEGRELRSERVIKLLERFSERFGHVFGGPQ